MGVDFDAVYPMIANPRNQDYSDPELRAASDAANRTWSKLLVQIDEAFNGDPAALIPAVHTHVQAARPGAGPARQPPVPTIRGRHAGPTFEWTAP